MEIVFFFPLHNYMTVTNYFYRFTFHVINYLNKHYILMFSKYVFIYSAGLLVKKAYSKT